jgi:hypothetical protein
MMAVAIALPIHAWADPLIDLTLFNPPDASHRKILEPTVSWVVTSQPSTYCEKVKPKDGFMSRPESCVYWQEAEKRCVVVTSNFTSHSELGHLFVACLKGSSQ